MVGKVKQMLAVIAAIALVVGAAFAYIPYSPVFPPVSLCASAPPRETNISAFTNSEGHVYRMFYDGQGRLIAATNAASEQVFRNYFDPCGNLTNKVDGASRPIHFQYDVLNHCTNTIYSDGSTEAFTFDAVGNLLTAKNAATTNTFAYDVMNHLTSSVSRVAGVAFTNQYRYDLGGLATNVVYPDGKTVRYAFDPDGNVTNIADWSNHTWTFTRDAAGRVTVLAYPNGISGSWGYDASSAVTNWAYTGSANLPGRRITRDAMGLKTSEKVTSGPMPTPATNRRAANTFDAADRLTSARVGTSTNPVFETYCYDGCGALTNIARSSGTNDSFTYDLAGRMIAATSSNVSLSLIVDALGNRVKTTINGDSRLWVIDHTDPLKRPLMETTTNGTPVRYYIWGAGRLLGIIESNGTLRCVHSDEQGSVVALTDGSGNVTDTFSCGPYGEDWGHTGTNSIPFRWLGGHGVWRVSESSTLYLTRHRAYDTTLKRFLSSDPMGLGGGNNLYAYGNGNPLAYIDPLGLCGETVAGGFFRGLGEYFTSGDYSANMNTACETILYSPYNAIAGTAGYLGRLTDDPSGTLNGTFNNPANAIQNVNAASFVNMLSDPVAISSAIWGGGLMAMGLSPSAAAGDSMVLGSAESSGVLQGANYAQRTFSSTFSSGGTFAGQTVEDVATALRSGTLSPTDVPIQYIVRDGNTLMLNTRSAQALEQAGIPRAQWNAIDMTGDAAAQARLNAQLQRSGLTSQGIPTVTGR